MIVIEDRQNNIYRYLEKGFIPSSAGFYSLNITFCTSFFFVLATVNGYNFYVTWIF
jgi:hypothetical protein